MRQLSEEKDKDILKEWQEEARKQTLETLPAFLKKLTEEYAHDYGTICHAIAAAAVGAAWAVERSPQGGITGFQGGAIMWEFMKMWNGIKFPARLIQYENLLYPQYCDGRFVKMGKDTFEYLKKEAARLLAEERTHPISAAVVAHWEALSRGENVTGMEITEDEE